MLTPLIVQPQGPTVTREIGNVTFVGNEAGNLYYVQWEHRGSAWTIATDIIGAAMQHLRETLKIV